MGAAASSKKKVETTPLVQTAERVWTSAHADDESVEALTVRTPLQ